LIESREPVTRRYGSWTERECHLRLIRLCQNRPGTDVFVRA
jgi:hypothetical protein